MITATNTELSYRIAIVNTDGTPRPTFITEWNALRSDVSKALTSVDNHAGDAEDVAQEAGAVETYTAGAAPISAPRVLMTVDGSRTVQHADPSSWPNAARIVGISVASASSGAPVEVRWLGEMSYDGWSWDLTKRIFLGSGGQLTQTAPASGFVRCVGQPITPTSMRVDIDAPIFRS